MTSKIKNPSWGQHWSILTFEVSTIQEFCMKEISSMDFPQHGEVFYGRAFAYIHYITLMLDPRWGSTGISDIPPTHPHFTKML
jgi:hypothetical protein